jgi:hypothetical protein
MGKSRTELVTWYPVLVAFSAWASGLLRPDRLYRASAAINLAAWLAHSGVQSYTQFRKVLVGLDQITWGILFFLIATAISMRKAGIWPQSASKSLLRLLAGSDHPHPLWAQPVSPQTRVRPEGVEREDSPG